MTWINLNGQLPHAQEILHSSSGVMKVIVSPADPNRVLLMSYGLWLWASKDGAHTFTTYTNSEGHLFFIEAHPFKSDWLIGMQESSGCGGTGAGACHKLALVSTDFGASWKTKASYVNQISWGSAGLPSKTPSIFPNNIPNEAVFFTRYTDISSAYPSHLSLFRSWDLFSNAEEIVSGGNSFVFFKNSFLFCAKTISVGNLELWISNDHGVTLSRAVFPASLSEHRYTLLDASQYSAAVSVEHDENGEWGNIYVSDQHGQNFALSLAHTRRESWGHADFSSFASLDGIYLANVIDVSDTSLIQTKISYDRGGEWTTLHTDCSSSKISKNGEVSKTGEVSSCQLHLSGSHKRALLSDSGHTELNSAGGVLHFSENAIGLALAAGNTGDYLAEHSDDFNTYFTRDAGLTWTFFSPGNSVYDFADHGGLILVAPTDVEVDKLRYTWDQGLSFSACSLAKKLIVRNIVSHPKTIAQNFLVYGILPQTTQYVIFSVDFSSLHERQCEGAEHPGKKDSDYEIFSPSDTREGKCLFGAEMQITRRKQDAQCWNGNEFDNNTLTTPCKCTRQDFECDFGYELEEITNECVATADAPSSGKPSDCNDYYYVTSGYRRIPGDLCVGGDDLSPKKKKCNSDSGTTTTVLIVLLSFCAAAVLFVKRESVLDSLSDCDVMVRRWKASRNAENRIRLQPSDSLLNGDDDDDDDDLLRV
eukprot:TRINITY_DN911_c0_g1_i2.p1 TRINITY_DN911_c0_g1~~TRINITY_DN911_c0_g1_i2.p1  ORF type:complete len:770 (+),score=201.52 TRINITY_DN911_c0_g1_i2:201-2312(+)